MGVFFSFAFYFFSGFSRVSCSRAFVLLVGEFSAFLIGVTVGGSRQNVFLVIGT